MKKTPSCYYKLFITVHGANFMSLSTLCCSLCAVSRCAGAAGRSTEDSAVCLSLPPPPASEVSGGPGCLSSGSLDAHEKIQNQTQKTHNRQESKRAQRKTEILNILSNKINVPSLKTVVTAGLTQFDIS